MKNTNIERFWKYVEKTESCWNWIGSLNRGGYGNFWDSQKKKIVSAHRFSYMIYFGDPSPLNVLHTCDNPRCVNPSHLWEGTHQENIQDAKEKGSWNPARSSKLKSGDINTIRELYKTGCFPQQTLAAQFKVGQPAISRIVCREHWVNVE